MVLSLNLQAQIAVIMLRLYIIVIIHTKVHKCENIESENDVCLTQSQNCEWRLNCKSRNISSPRFQCNNSKIVTVLYIDDNIIHYIDNNTFVALSNLHTLSLQNNKINKIEQHTFRPLGKLQYLYLRNNSIEEIEENLFQNQTVIWRIDLEYNQLTRLNSGVFTNCDNLYQVYLAHNKIEEINEDSFKENSTVGHLYSSHNRIHNLRFLKNLPKLRFLDLSYNMIAEIPTNTLLPMQGLKTLDLSHNKIEIIKSGTFGELPALENLSLADNMLKYLGEGPFDNLHKLDHLDLCNNFLENFSYNIVFEERNNLTLYLYIDNNNWYCKFIHQLKQLRWITLRYGHVNNVSNVDGIPCLDGKQYSEKSISTSTSTSTSPSTSTTISQLTKFLTQLTTVANISKSTSNNNIEITTPRQTTTTSQHPIYEEVLPQETNFRTILTLPEIRINVSLYIVAIVTGIILVLVAVVVSAILIRRRFSRPRENGPEYSKDEYMVPACLPPARSNFYVTMASYNSYEEIDEDHIYTEIDTSTL